jgi:hypothetical protein
MLYSIRFVFSDGDSLADTALDDGAEVAPARVCDAAFGLRLHRVAQSSIPCRHIAADNHTLRRKLARRCPHLLMQSTGSADYLFLDDARFVSSDQLNISPNSSSRSPSSGGEVEGFSVS